MKILPFFSVIIMMFLGPSKCSEAQKIQKNPPLPLGEIYFETWASPIKSGGSGFNLFIPLNENNDSGIALDSVYFRNQYAKLVKKITDSSLVYIAQFDNPQRSNDDIIMSSDPLEEMKNVPPAVPKKMPFNLGPTEAMVSYQVDGEVQYFKIENIKEKASNKTPRS